MTALLVVHPDVAAVIAGGRVQVTLYDATRATVSVVESDDPALGAILLCFARPASVGALVERVRDVDARSLVDAVEALRGSGILVDADPSTAPSPATTPEPQPPPESARAVHDAATRSARALTRLVAEIADDLDAFGPLGASPPATDASAITRRLRLLEGQAQLLAGSLRDRRRPFLDAQLERLGITAETRGLRLNVGAADRPLPGWLNVDLSPADLSLDLRWGLPLAGESVRLVYMAHVLEHFNFRAEAAAVLTELRRVLAPGGTARIVVPDIEKYLRAYVDRDLSFFEARERHWGPSPGAALLPKLLHYAGAGSWPEERHGHKFGYDFETLRELLLECGFRAVVRSDFMMSEESELRVDDRSWAGTAKHGAEPFSLFVDAVA